MPTQPGQDIVSDRVKNKNSVPKGHETNFVTAERRAYGSLVLGGFDESRTGATDLTIDFAAEDYVAPLASVLSIVGTNTLQGVISFTTSGAFLASIDSSVSEMWLPRPVCDAFERAFGLLYDGSTERYLANSTLQSQLKALNPSLTFRLGSSTNDTGNSTNVILPFAAFSQQASWPIYNTSTSYFPLRRAANESQYTLGRVFLQEAYLIVDFERQHFTISQAQSPDIHTPSNLTAIPSLSNINIHHSKVGTGVIVGSSVGAAVALVAILLVTYYLSRRRRRSSPQIKEPAEEKPIDVSGVESEKVPSVAELHSKDLRHELEQTERYELASNDKRQELDSIPVIQLHANDKVNVYEKE
jgi:hypothetical protein